VIIAIIIVVFLMNRIDTIGWKRQKRLEKKTLR